MKPLTTTTPHVIIMVGIPGSGKTTFAEHFAKTFQAPIVNQAAIALEAGLDEKTATKISSHFLDELLKTHRTIIYEGPTHAKSVRRAIAKRVESAGYAPLFLWVQTESAEAKRRAMSRQKKSPQLTSEQFDAAIRQFTPLSIQEKPVVISGKHTYASQLKIVLRHLAGARTESSSANEPRSSRSIAIR